MKKDRVITYGIILIASGLSIAGCADPQYYIPAGMLWVSAILHGWNRCRVPSQTGDAQ